MAVPVLTVVVALSVPEPLVQALGGLVSKASDSAKFFTWCITPEKSDRIYSSLDEKFSFKINTTWFNYYFKK